MGNLNLIYSGSSSGPNTANIILYPNDSGADEDSCEGDIATAIDTGFSYLTDGGYLGEYNVYEYEMSNYPQFDSSSVPYKELQYKWVDWLDNNSEYWYSMEGCHMIVANEYLDSGGPGNSDYNRNINIDQIEDCAFNTAQAMILGLDDGHNYALKQENFAIQEPWHTFIPEEWIINNTNLLDSNSPDEHQLGYVTSEGSSTPMLTGHAGSDDWYYNEKGLGHCQTDWSWNENYIKIPTGCTEEAIYKTAKNA